MDIEDLIELKKEFLAPQKSIQIGPRLLVYKPTLYTKLTHLLFQIEYIQQSSVSSIFYKYYSTLQSFQSNPLASNHFKFANATTGYPQYKSDANICKYTYIRNLIIRTIVTTRSNNKGNIIKTSKEIRSTVCSAIKY